MTPRQDNFPHPHPKAPPRSQPLTVVHPHAAGIDVGAYEHWVAVSPDVEAQARRFGSRTCDLEAIADWLIACGVTSVAMESTGVYWVPLFELLERRGLQVFLVDARQAKNVKGRPKTDRLDCKWLQRLHSYGLLTAAFRPEDQVCVLRGYLRQRAMLVRYAAQHIQHMQKALEQMNVKLTEIVSDITGVTGMSIIKALLAGERDAQALAKLRNRHCQCNEAGFVQALQGNWRVEHLFELQQAVELYECYHDKIRDCDREVQAHLKTFADRRQGKKLDPRPQQRKRKANAPCFDARSELFRVTGIDLTAIEGIDETTALVLLSELGTDMSRWPSVKHFSSWLGLCPQHKITGGKILSRKVRGGAGRAARALRLAARSLHQSKSALGAFFRRIKGRLGTPKAIVATAHKLARLVYYLLRYGTEYVAKGMAEYEQQYQERRVGAMTRQARELGYRLVPLE